MDYVIISYILYGFAGCLFACGIWGFIRTKLAKGKNYDELRAEMETLRHQIKQKQSSANPEEFEKTVSLFNKNAKRLRIPLYGEE